MPSRKEYECVYCWKEGFFNTRICISVMCCYGFNSIQIYKGISGLLEEENCLMSVPFLKVWPLLSTEAEQITIKLKMCLQK